MAEFAKEFDQMTSMAGCSGGICTDLGGCPSSRRHLLMASCREFEEASGSEFDVPTITCNNPAPSIFDEQIDQEKQQLLNDFEKLLNDRGYLDFDHSQSSDIQLCPENSALATIS